MIREQASEFNTYLATARFAAMAGGAILKEHYRGKKDISYKGRIDVVTNMDLASERMIVNTIRLRFPEHDIVSEESTFTDSGSEYKWIIDPLDGTVNYAHGFPFLAVSIALEIRSRLVVGVVYNPIMDEFFHAVQGGGAFLNDEPILVSETAELEKSLLATGFGYDVRENPRNNLAEFNHLVKIAQGIRRPGSAALDACYVAAGRFDGYWELTINPWDIAAGMLIVREAGGVATRLDGGSLSPFDSQIVCSNGRIQEKLLAELARAL